MESSGEQKYRGCRRRHTSECPHAGTPEMKRLVDTPKEWEPKTDKAVDMISRASYRRVEEFCLACDVYEAA